MLGSIINSFLFSIGLRKSHADSSPFIFRHGTQTIFLLLYVDDIVITGSDTVISPASET